MLPTVSNSIAILTHYNNNEFPYPEVVRLVYGLGTCNAVVMVDPQNVDFIIDGRI